MQGKWRAGVVSLALAVAVGWLFAANGSAEPGREGLMKALPGRQLQGRLRGLRKLALDPDDDPLQVGNDLDTAITCLQRLGRSDEIDDFREGVIDVHKQNWRLLETAAQTYVNGEHYGFIVAGKFYRGNQRGGGRYVNAIQRDRVRALQLMQQALPLSQGRERTSRPSPSSTSTSPTCSSTAPATTNRGACNTSPTWPSCPTTRKATAATAATAAGAPVDADGNPVYYTGAQELRDGPERRRALALDADPGRRVRPGQRQRGRHDLRQLPARPVRRADDGPATAALPRRRRRQEDDQRHLRPAHPERRRDHRPPGHRHQALQAARRVQLDQDLSSASPAAARAPPASRPATPWPASYEDRRQYVKAADAWKKAIEEYGAGQNNYRQQRLDQIVGNWGRFEPGEVQPAGTKATVDFRFRNGNKVSFEAHAINVAKLLDDVKAYLKSNPGAARLAARPTSATSATAWSSRTRSSTSATRSPRWDLDLKPRPEHVDDRVTVTTPLQKPGAYLLTGKMADGNISRIIVWVSDTVIVKKQLDGKVLYYVADAVTGQPVAKADLEFFGWRQVQVEPNSQRVPRRDRRVQRRRPTPTARSSSARTSCRSDYQWLVTARKAKDGQGGADRFAYLGFTSVWYGQQLRPRVQPDQGLHHHRSAGLSAASRRCSSSSGSRHAKYDQPDTSDFAGQPFTVRIHNPAGRKGLREDAAPPTPTAASTASSRWPRAPCSGVYRHPGRRTTAAAASASRSTRSPSSR